MGIHLRPHPGREMPERVPTLPGRHHSWDKIVRKGPLARRRPTVGERRAPRQLHRGRILRVSEERNGRGQRRSRFDSSHLGRPRLYGR